MATAAIAGYKALVKTSTSSTGGTLTQIAELRDYTLTGTHDTFDATSHDSSGERERIGGITGWTASAEALFVDDKVPVAVETLFGWAKTVQPDGRFTPATC